MASKDPHRRATQEMATAMDHMAKAIVLLSDDLDEPGQTPADQSALTQPALHGPPVAPKTHRMMVGWGLLIGGERMHALVQLGRAILDHLPKLY
jgi:hypothetical protein